MDMRQLLRAEALIIRIARAASWTRPRGDSVSDMFEIRKTVAARFNPVLVQKDLYLWG
jgi:hypothetical protein